MSDGYCPPAKNQSANILYTIRIIEIDTAVITKTTFQSKFQQYYRHIYFRLTRYLTVFRSSQPSPNAVQKKEGPAVFPFLGLALANQMGLVVSMQRLQSPLVLQFDASAILTHW